MPLLTAPSVHVHVATLGDAQIPDAALAASLATLSRHFRCPIEVHRHPQVPAERPASDAEELAGEFPVYQDGRLVTRSDLTSPASDRSAKVYTLPAPDNGILGVAGIPTASDPRSDEVWLSLRPIVEPNVILVMAIPGARNGYGHTGFTTQVVNPDGTMRSGLVILRQSAIEHRASVLVPTDRLWEWTLTHEVGHILGVPVDNTHSQIVRGYGGVHCTHPECVMSTGVDWRTIVSGILHGWPLDYCDLCSAEVRSAYGLAPAPAGKPTRSTGMGTR